MGLDGTMTDSVTSPHIFGCETERSCNSVSQTGANAELPTRLNVFVVGNDSVDIRICSLSTTESGFSDIGLQTENDRIHSTTASDVCQMDSKGSHDMLLTITLVA